MKPLAELQMELDLGLFVFCSTHPDMVAYQAVIHDHKGDDIGEGYSIEKGMSYNGCLVLTKDHLSDFEHALVDLADIPGYAELQNLLTSLVRQPVWSTMKTPERIQFEADEQRHVQEVRAQEKHRLDEMFPDF